jgi:VanZ family protein
MARVSNFVRRWGPATVVMALIFAFSSVPSTRLPAFGLWDVVVKKGGHVLGYGLLALAYLHGLDVESWQGGSISPFACSWFMVLLYAISDEFHQSFVSGRHPSFVDVFLFDAGGAVVVLAVAGYVLKKACKR